MSNCKLATTPAQLNLKLEKTKPESSEANATI